MSDDSVTQWIDPFQQGDPTAASELWRRYIGQIQALARQKLVDGRPELANSEDVALSTFRSFQRAVQEGRVEALTDRDQLWRLLVVITSRKVAQLLRDQNGVKRGSSVNRINLDTGVGNEWLPAAEPTPEFVVQSIEEYQRLLKILDEPILKRIALMRMEGHTTAEIAQHLDCSEKAVKRKLCLIRVLWRDEVPGDEC